MATEIAVYKAKLADGARIQLLAEARHDVNRLGAAYQRALATYLDALEQAGVNRKRS